MNPDLQSQTDQLLKALEHIANDSDVICYAQASIILLLVALLIITLIKR